MIICPNCNHENMAGAAFCTDCGAMLLETETLTTQKIRKVDASQEAPPRTVAAAPASKPPRPSSPTDNWATLHLLDSGQNLGPFRAYTHGVSRLHAVIRRGVNNVLVSDLESANGTFVNGQRLPANEERSLSHGDVVSLGGLKIQILLKTT
jgi:pSer/pThr/pTyr-binding forkhead associated (FHA) protein